jgi:signal transduction histidine kinase
MNGVANRARVDDAKKVANFLGGDIVVESEEGKGSKFTVTIPMELKQ